MDDRELEARLRAHLHARLDAAQPSPELAAAVAQVVATRPKAVDRRGFRQRPARLGLGVAVAAALVVAAIAITNGGLLRLLGPAAPNATPAPTVGVDRRTFVVTADPSNAAAPGDASAANEVLMARLSLLDAPGLSGAAVQGWIQLDVDVSNPAGAPDIAAILGATGDVSVVGLPREDYGDQLAPGPVVAQVGEPLPTEETSIFGTEDIALATAVADEQGRRVLSIELTPDAARRFGAYTTAHVREYMALLVDGKVAAAPSINEPITGGEVQISGSTLRPDRFAEAMAIVVGGRLPESWASPQVVEVVDRDPLLDALLAQYPQGGLRSAYLDVVRAGAVWRPIWRVVLDGDFEECGGVDPSGQPGCLTADSIEILVDAATGDVVSTSAPAPEDR